MTQIEPIQCEYIINTSDKTINNFWEKINTENNSTSVIKFEQVLNKISNAVKKVYIYASSIVSKDFNEILHKIWNENVRVYIIISEDIFPEMVKKPFKKGIIRNKSNIKSSFVLIDPDSKDCYGYWTPDPLSEISSAIIKLNKKQIKSFTHLFIEYFWSETGSKEIIMGNTLDKSNFIEKPYDKNKIKYEEIIKLKNINYFENIEETINSVWIKREDINYFNEKLFLADVTELLIEESKILKDFFNTNIIDELSKDSEIMITKLPFSLVSYNDNIWIISGDLMIKISDKQLEPIKSSLELKWEFSFEKDINSIKNGICVYKDEWENISNNITYITDTKDIILDDINIEKIDVFKEAYETKEKCFDTPDIPNDHFYSKEIKYKWKINPPLLHNNAIKHDLYQKWPKAIKKILKYIEDINKGMKHIFDFDDNKYLQKSKESRQYFKKHEKGWRRFIEENNDFIKYLNDLETQILDNIRSINQNTKSELVDKINYFNTQINKYHKELKDQYKIIDTNINDFETKLNEIDRSNKKKTKITKEIREGILKISKFANKNIRELVFNVKDIPYYTAPKFGELYKVGNVNYIAIKDYDEIEKATKIANGYENAIICVRRQ